MSTYSDTMRELMSPGRLVAAPPGTLAPARGLRLTAAVMLPLAAGSLLHHPGYGVFAALGALPTGFASIQGERRKRAGAAALAAAGTAVGAFLGALTAGHPWLLLPVVTAFAYAAGVLGVFSDRVSTAVVQWPAALLLATATPDTPRQAAVRAGFVLAGGLGQTALTALASASPPSAARPPRRAPGEFARHLARTVRAHLGVGTLHGQHALRLAAAAAATQGLATLLGLSHGYWAALTAVFVLKTDHELTVRRSLHRIGGTAVGVLVGVPLALLAAHGSAALLVAAAAAIALAYTVFCANYFLFTVFLTGFVVVLLDLLGEGAAHTAGPRLAATVLGGLAALAASHVRPGGPRRTGLPTARPVR